MANRAGAMRNDAKTQPTSPPPPNEDPPFDAERVAAGLADLARAADSLRQLDLEGIEPAFAFDAAWESEEAAG